MRVFWALGAFAPVLTGCLLTEPINVPPTVQIAETSPPALFRGDAYLFEASVTDDDDVVTLTWGHVIGPCPLEPASGPVEHTGGPSEGFAFTPASHELGPVCIWVEARDGRGARTRTHVGREIENRAPVVALAVEGDPMVTTQLATMAVGVPLGAEVRLVLNASDPDPNDTVTTQLRLQGPDQKDVPLSACSAGTPDLSCFRPTRSGTWRARAEVQDALGARGTGTDLLVEVGPDLPPCLATTPESPIVLHDTRLPLLLEARSNDDLDPAPPRDGMPTQASFRWSLSARDDEPLLVLVDNTGRSLRVPADRFRPADVLRVRVEAFDRVTRPPTCAPDDDTCGAGSACRQRFTWRIEFR